MIAGKAAANAEPNQKDTVPPRQNIPEYTYKPQPHSGINPNA